MKKMLHAQSIILFLKAVAAVFLFGMLPLGIHAEPSNVIAVCLNTDEVFFFADTVGFGLSTNPQITQGGSSSAKAEFSDVIIEKSFDANSPLLFMNAAKGTYWSTVDIVVYPSDVSFPLPRCFIPGAKSIMSVTLHSAAISLFATEADADRVIESIAFSYGKICLSEEVGTNVLCWDVINQKSK